MKSDIEIAQEVKMKNIYDVAKTAGIDEKYLEQYGKYKAKIDLSLLTENNNEEGKLILVTAITPTPAGEGKTTTTIGLADGLKKIGKNVIAALREPSLGPVFGIKGGACRRRLRTNSSNGRYKFTFYRRFSCNRCSK